MSNSGPPPEKKQRKETLMSSELGKFLDKKVRVKFQGGREATGVLKGYDQLLNLVLDGTVEHIQDPEDPFKITAETRSLGLVICRGTAVVLICPFDSMEQIANPFIQQEQTI
ncbi:U6 snRNA-associated Sm-like protein LSm7 [Halichondria panicea]|uniref:U6 snRNA-associated Sm-like protein LSm7 n=1 Tax=Halichondria panicea TaxID=6063 RepID=UPI00312B7B0B